MRRGLGVVMVVVLLSTASVLVAYAEGVMPNRLTPVALANDNWQSRNCPESPAKALQQARVRLLDLRCPNPGVDALPAMPQGSKGTLVAIGDSFSAGEGDPEIDVFVAYSASSFLFPFGVWGPGSGFYFPTDFKSSQGSNKCHLSPHAYPVGLAAELGLTLDFRACSGAKTVDYFKDSKKQSLPPATGTKYRKLPSQNAAAFPPDTKVITLGFGGNDVGFSDVVTACAVQVPPNACTRKANSARSTVSRVRAGIDSEQQYGLDNMLANIVSNKPKGARVVLTSYPRLFPTKSRGRSCSVGTGFATITPGNQSAVNMLVDALNSVLRQAASAAHIDFVDMGDAFEDQNSTPGSEGDHGMCQDKGPDSPDGTSTTRWVNRIQLVNAFTMHGAELGSAHPNTLGQMAYKNRMMACITDQANCANVTDKGRFEEKKPNTLNDGPFSGVKWNLIARKDLDCQPDSGAVWDQMHVRLSRAFDFTGDGKLDVSLTGSCPTDTSAGHYVRVVVYDGASPVDHPRIIGMMPDSTIDMRDLSIVGTDQHEMIAFGPANAPGSVLAESPSLTVRLVYQWDGNRFFLKSNVTEPLRRDTATKGQSHTTTGTTTPRKPAPTPSTTPDGEIFAVVTGIEGNVVTVNEVTYLTDPAEVKKVCAERNEPPSQSEFCNDYYLYDQKPTLHTLPVNSNVRPIVLVQNGGTTKQSLAMWLSSLSNSGVSRLYPLWKMNIVKNRVAAIQQVFVP